MNCNVDKANAERYIAESRGQGFSNASRYPPYLLRLAHGRLSLSISGPIDRTQNKLQQLHSSECRMQRLRIMAATCLQQIACSPLSSGRALAVGPSNAEGLRCLSTSSTVFVKPWWRQSALVSLRTITARPALIATRVKFNVIAQAVSTTPETEAEAAPETTSEVTAIEVVNGDDALSPLKTKKLTKQVKHIMNILNAEALEAATKDKVIPQLRPGDVVQLRVEVPENKRRVSLLRGIVIAIHNAGINSTFRIRRVLAGVGVEMIFPLYSPNIKELKVIDKRRARRAKLYYLRDKIARLSSC